MLGGSTKHKKTTPTIPRLIKIFYHKKHFSQNVFFRIKPAFIKKIFFTRAEKNILILLNPYNYNYNYNYLFIYLFINKNKKI